MRRILIAAASLAILPALTWAQGRGGGGGFHAAAAPAPHMAMHAAAPAASHSFAAPHATSTSGGHYVYTRSGAIVYRPATHGTSVHNGGRNGSRRLVSQDVVPGLGFDYAHLAAVGAGRGRFGRGRDRHFPVVAYFPFFGGGYYPLFPDDYEEPAAAEDQQAEAAPPADYYPQGYAPTPRPGDADLYRPPAATAASAPERSSDEYVFVRRDGTLFFAVAYTWENGSLRYVTNEGLRRSVAGTALDLDATQQFNEQRGLTFRLPVA